MKPYYSLYCFIFLLISGCAEDNKIGDKRLNSLPKRVKMYHFMSTASDSLGWSMPFTGMLLRRHWIVSALFYPGRIWRCIFLISQPAITNSGLEMIMCPVMHFIIRHRIPGWITLLRDFLCATELCQVILMIFFSTVRVPFNRIPEISCQPVAMEEVTTPWWSTETIPCW